MKDIDYAIIMVGGKEGEKEMQRLLQCHEGYITKFAQSYLSRAREDGNAVMLSDLKSAAKLGMILSLKKYDPDKGGFLGWATNYMKSAINDWCGLSTIKPFNDDTNDFFQEVSEDDESEDEDGFACEEEQDYSIDYEPDSEELPLANASYSVKTGYEGGEKVPISDDSADDYVNYKEVIDRIREVLNDEEFKIFCRYRGLAGYRATDLPEIAKDMNISLLHAQCAYSHSLCELKIDE